jgi:hypothetical protein
MSERRLIVGVDFRFLPLTASLSRHVHNIYDISLCLELSDAILQQLCDMCLWIWNENKSQTAVDQPRHPDTMFVRQFSEDTE